MKKLIPLLLLVLVLVLVPAVGCDLTGLTVTTTTESPVISSFEADPPTITAGGSATLKWNVSGATKVSIDQGIGSVALSGSRAVMPSATTVYTLTATNVSGATVPATAQVIVTGAAPPPASLPFVNSFTASPPNITAGGSATLSWNVSNVTSVTIDPGLGTFTSSGSTIVLPAATTNYILTATNAAGSTTAAAQVTVSGAPPPIGAPDLVITSIDRVETPEGYKINYTIKNQGTATAGASTTKLYASTVYKASDSVGLLAAGASETKQFTVWVFNPSTPQIKVVADADGAVVEADEANNEKQLNYAIQIRYNFVDNAGAATVTWRTGPPAAVISFGGSGPDGSASYATSVTMEDGTSYGKVLATHPKWVNDGFIWGYYNIDHEIKSGAHFVAKIGIVKGGLAGNVKFQVIMRPEGMGAVTIYSGDQVHDGVLKTIDVAIDPIYFGKKADFELTVSANGPSNQDWAAWVEARIIR